MGPDRAVSPQESRHRPAGPPRGHWLGGGLLLLVFTLRLLVEGYTHGVLGASAARIAQAAAARRGPAGAGWRRRTAASRTRCPRRSGAPTSRPAGTAT